MPEKTTGSLGSLILLRKAVDEGALSTDPSSSCLVTANPRLCINAPLHLAFIALAWLETEARIGKRMIVPSRQKQRFRRFSRVAAPRTSLPPASLSLFSVVKGLVEHHHNMNRLPWSHNSQLVCLLPQASFSKAMECSAAASSLISSLFVLFSQSGPKLQSFIPALIKSAAFSPIPYTVVHAVRYCENTDFG
jgi:hypothetical protein